MLATHLQSGDDALKDEDNACWVMQLAAAERNEWLTVLQWVRSADRLLERSWRDFAVYLDDWRALRFGVVRLASPHRELFGRLAERWARERTTELELLAWDEYLEAQWDYRVPARAIRCDADYRLALFRMSAGIFQALPYKPKHLHGAIGWLGALDQLFNNLRDLREDVDRGLCCLPDDLLARFGIVRDELPELVRCADARFAHLWEHELEIVAPKLRRRLATVFAAEGLHPSWVMMLKDLERRHARIEAVARDCRFDATAFSRAYWGGVSDAQPVARACG